MFNFLRGRRTPKQQTIEVQTSNNHHELTFQFYKVVDGEKEKLPVPIPTSRLKELSTIEGFHRYTAFDLLREDGQIHENNKLSIRHLYRWFEAAHRAEEVGFEQLTEEEQTFVEWADIVQGVSPSVELEDVVGELSIQGTPALDPTFDLELYQDGKNLAQVAAVHLPFVVQGDVRYHLPLPLYRLFAAMQRTDYEDGYEKTAVVQKLATDAGVTMDDFLKREDYHLVDSYEIVPHAVDDETVELRVIGSSEEATEHLNTVQRRSSTRQGMRRERYVSPKEIVEDVQTIQQKSVFRGEEIPQLLQNPEAFFPDLNVPFHLENFSDRVVGFTKITRPTLQVIGEERRWFDQETGETLTIDEEELREAVESQPDRKFVSYRSGWVFVDRGMKKALGLIEEEEKEETVQYALDIMGNEEEVNYAFSGRSLESVPDYPLPRNLRATLYDHQNAGYNWLYHLYTIGSSGLLADDMGLGKTLQVITFLQKLHEERRLFPSLIVLPIALIQNWENEIKQFAPELSDSVYIHRGSKRLKELEALQEKQLIFTSYDTLKVDQLLLGQIGFECIILDEAQNIKSNASGRSRAIRAMQGKFRLAMTGTPVENSLEELWTIMDFVQPGALDSLAMFKEKYIKGEQYRALIDTLQPYYLRRTKEEVMKDKLPDKHIVDPFYVPAANTQQELGQAMLTNVQSKVSNMLNVINELRMLYAHPHAVDASMAAREMTPKLEKVVSILKEVERKQEKVLIFTEFRKVQVILKQVIQERYNIEVPVVNGETNDRPAVVREFNETPGFGVMILSPKAAGVGLTITGANHVIHYTRWWNPAVENQATDRAYRIGQTKDVYVYQIITKDPKNFPSGTVEEIMHRILEEKSDLAEHVIIPFDVSHLQKEVQHALLASS